MLLKNQIFLIIGIIAILLAGCGLEPVDTTLGDGGDNNVSITRGPCDGQPNTKSITFTNPTWVTYRGPSSGLNKFFSDIYNGVRTYNYSDTCYSGTLKSVSMNMIQSPRPVNPPDYNMFTCTVTINYTGTVKRKVVVDPCAGLPSSKSVTFKNPALVTYTGPASGLNTFFSAIYNGRRSYYYSDKCYKGIIYSVSMNMVKTPQPVSYNSSIYTTSVTINYAGIVKKK